MASQLVLAALPKCYTYTMVALMGILHIPIFVQSARLLDFGSEALDERSMGTGCPHCVLKEGDTHKCSGLTFTLGELLGKGQWGAVFRTVDGRYAVKVQTQKNTDDKFQLMEPKHECKIMRDLQRTRGLKVPACRAICEVDDRQILVMDLVKKSKDMSEIRWDTASHANYDMYRVGKQVYTGVTAMLGKDIVNVDQEAKNILLAPDSTVYFIDMGMAEHKKEIYRVCNDPDTAKTYKEIMNLADLGIEAGCESQIGQEYAMTATQALDSLPDDSFQAMKGMVDAFCEAPHRELVANVYYRIFASGQDRLFLTAFRGKFNYAGNKVAEPMLVHENGSWRKVDDKPIKVTSNQYRRGESVDIPKGAILTGIKCDGVESLENLAHFDPLAHKSDICDGWYYFKLTGFQYVADKVMDILDGAYFDGAEKLKNRAASCKVRSK